jgi:hypothetical protein
MSENHVEQPKGGTLNGIAIGGKITKKMHYPAKDGMNPSWSVAVSYFGGTSNVSVTQQAFDRIAVGATQIFLVSQRGSKTGGIYNTAIES